MTELLPTHPNYGVPEEEIKALNNISEAFKDSYDKSLHTKYDMETLPFNSNIYLGELKEHSVELGKSWWTARLFVMITLSTWHLIPFRDYSRLSLTDGASYMFLCFELIYLKPRVFSKTPVTERL